MLPDYADIRALTAQEPNWYNEDGVPRYRQFHPTMLGVYDVYAVLLDIQCQGCEMPFRVGVGRVRYDITLECEVITHSVTDLATRYNYGDPPRHGCGGDSMLSSKIRVLEAWRRHEMLWLRVPALEARD